MLLLDLGVVLELQAYRGLAVQRDARANRAIDTGEDGGHVGGVGTHAELLRAREIPHGDGLACSGLDAAGALATVVELVAVIDGQAPAGDLARKAEETAHFKVVEGLFDDTNDDAVLVGHHRDDLDLPFPVARGHKNVARRGLVAVRGRGLVHKAVFLDHALRVPRFLVPDEPVWRASGVSWVRVVRCEGGRHRSKRRRGLLLLQSLIAGSDERVQCNNRVGVQDLGGGDRCRDLFRCQQADAGTVQQGLLVVIGLAPRQSTRKDLGLRRTQAVRGKNCVGIRLGKLQELRRANGVSAVHFNVLQRNALGSLGLGLGPLLNDLGLGETGISLRISAKLLLAAILALLKIHRHDVNLWALAGRRH